MRHVSWVAGTPRSQEGRPPGATARGRPQATSTGPGPGGVRTEATPGVSIREAPHAQVLQEAAFQKAPSTQEGRGTQWPKDQKTPPPITNCCQATARSFRCGPSSSQGGAGPMPCPVGSLGGGQKGPSSPTRSVSGRGCWESAPPRDRGFQKCSQVTHPQKNSNQERQSTVCLFTRLRCCLSQIC